MAPSPAILVQMPPMAATVLGEMSFPQAAALSATGVPASLLALLAMNLIEAGIKPLQP